MLFSEVFEIFHYQFGSNSYQNFLQVWMFLALISWWIFAVEEVFPSPGASPCPVEVTPAALVVVAALVPPNGINSAVPEEIVMSSPKAVAMQDNADSPQDPHSPAIFASWPVTWFKS